MNGKKKKERQKQKEIDRNEKGKKNSKRSHISRRWSWVEVEVPVVNGVRKNWVAYWFFLGRQIVG